MTPGAPPNSTVLFVDDDPSLLRGLEAYFSRLDYDVAVAGSGEEGIASYRRRRPDVAVVDLNMPDMSGLDVLAEMTRHDVAVVMLTGVGEVQDAVEAMRRGAENFLTKPVDMPHLAAAVERAAEKATLRQEIRSMRAQASLGGRRRMVRMAAIAGLAVVSALLGLAIGGGWASQEPDLAIPVPIQPEDSAFRPNN